MRRKLSEIIGKKFDGVSITVPDNFVDVSKIVSLNAQILAQRL